MIKASGAVRVVENAIPENECDYFTQKLIKKFKQGELNSFFDVPEVLIIEEPDEEDRLFMQKCYDALSYQVMQTYGEGPFEYMDGSLSLWIPGIKGTPHVDNADPQIKSYGAKYSSIFYLNDNYDGGEIEFPNLDFSYKPVKGSFVWFPDDPVDPNKDWKDWFHHEHLHTVNEVIGHYRCTLPIWIG